MEATALVAVAIAAVAVGAALLHFVATQRQQSKRERIERAVAQAASDYLAKFGVRSRSVCATLADGKLLLMIETAPHKKLRFSYIIEPSIRNAVHKETGVEVLRIFWRFPIPPQATQVPDIHYGEATTTQILPDPASSASVETASVKTVPDEEIDDYFAQPAYQIEEVSWDDFKQTVAQDVAADTSRSNKS